MATGDIEIDLEEIQVLNKASESLPIPVYDYHKVSVTLFL
jgi:aspartyl-tRNA synthetase